MKKYLLTGGCGFIGSHLADELLKMGHEVRVIDNLSTGRRSNLDSRAELIVGDVRDEQLVELAMNGVEGCFHLAAVSSVEKSVSDWSSTHAANLSGTINIFDAARPTDKDLAVPVVYASSAAIYGDNASMPLAEDATPRPLTAYGADKLGCELHARVAGLIHQIPTTGLRFFNVYGPRQDPHSPYSGVISIFVDRILSGQPVTIFGDGQQIRDFVFVSDVIQFLLRGMERASTSAPIFNVCTGNGTNITQLARTLGSVSGTGVHINGEAARTGDIRISLGDPRRARQKLNMEATVSLGTGLRETLLFMKSSANAAA